jgi:hypothetical protein
MDLAKFKKNVKHYLPEIIVGTTVAAAAATAAIWAMKSSDSIPQLALFFSADDLATIIDKDTPMTFTTEFGKLLVSHV